MIAPVQGGFKHYIETLIYIHYHLCSVFTSVRVKIRWQGEVNILYQSKLEKSSEKSTCLVAQPLLIFKLSMGMTVVQETTWHIFKVIYSLRFYIDPWTEPGLKSTNSTTRKLIDPESSGSWKNVSTSNWITVDYGFGTMLFQFLYILGNVLNKLSPLMSCHFFSQVRGVRSPLR